MAQPPAPERSRSEWAINCAEPSAASEAGGSGASPDIIRGRAGWDASTPGTQGAPPVDLSRKAFANRQEASSRRNLGGSAVVGQGVRYRRSTPDAWTPRFLLHSSPFLHPYDPIPGIRCTL